MRNEGLSALFLPRQIARSKLDAVVLSMPGKYLFDGITLNVAS